MENCFRPIYQHRGQGRRRRETCRVVTRPRGGVWVIGVAGRMRVTRVLAPRLIRAGLVPEGEEIMNAVARTYPRVLSRSHTPLAHLRLCTCARVHITAAKAVIFSL